MVQERLIPIVPQLSNRPAELNLPDFANFEVITQGDDGSLLEVLRTSPKTPTVDKFIQMFEDGAATVAIRSCDSSKPDCKVSPLNHFALSYEDYLMMGKAWSEVFRYVKASEFKFKEDPRRIKEMISKHKPVEVIK